MSRTDAGVEQGFSLPELVVAMAITLLVMSGVFAALGPASDAFSLEPEVADQQQRLRVAADAIARDLRAAGRGASLGSRAGPLTDAFAAVLPFRQGRRQADAPGRFRTDAMTVLAVATDAVQTTIAHPLPAASGTVRLSLDPGCPRGDSACGFRAGMDVVVFDGSGAFDTFEVVGVQVDQLTLDHNMAPSAVVYPSGSTIVEASSRTFYLKSDPVAGAFQLMQYDGGSDADAPIADHVVSLRFDYFGEPRAPAMRVAPTDPFGPWTTYGPRPPPAGVASTGYPAGENCVFARDAAQVPVPRLAVLGGGASPLMPLGIAELTDGPWCPDATSPSRYDADLLRVRAVTVTLRVEAADDGMRGPAGALFVRSGRSSSGRRWLPDRAQRFTIAPRNLDVRR